jgi:hypothetical protein
MRVSWAKQQAPTATAARASGPAFGSAIPMPDELLGKMCGHPAGGRRAMPHDRYLPLRSWSIGATVGVATLSPRDNNWGK